jgi:3-dehydroquinate synthase
MIMGHTFNYIIDNQKIQFLFEDVFSSILNYAPQSKIVIITDENIDAHHNNLFTGFHVIKIQSGEIIKTQQTVDAIIDQLLAASIGKDVLIVGVGGGVVTDIAGYVASVYKRGTRLGLVPTSLLAMVDAALGGKNGVNVGQYKNMVGTIYQPEFILFDLNFLKSLPISEWENGFAEIIKHACIKDASMFENLCKHNLTDYQTNFNLLAALIEENVHLKMNVVVEDVFEKKDRKLLNFGHTLGHAIENVYNISHGKAVSIGMVFASKLSEKITGFDAHSTQQMIQLLEKYQLPTSFEIDHDKIIKLLFADKKRIGNEMHFVLLNELGSAEAKPILLNDLENYINEIMLCG